MSCGRVERDGGVPGRGSAVSSCPARKGAAWATATWGLLVLGLVVVAAACPREGVNGDIHYIGEIGPDTASGVVRRVGNAPFTRTILDREEAVVITGPYEPELSRLTGAEVRVTGRVTPGEFPGPTLEAMSYEILSVDGERPLLGTLGRDADGFYLTVPGGTAVRLAAVSETLAESAGGRVWVILDSNGGVAQYGILRAP